MQHSDLTRWSRGLALVAVATAIALVPAAPAWAQGTDTGAINAVVTDPDGAALPGVMVLVEGPLGTRTGYTGVDGTTRFPGLYPGQYSATFSLDGFNTVVREGLEISAARSVRVSVEMELSSVEETITVTGESPVVDVKSTNVGRLYTDELIDKAPTASGLWAGVMDHVPGVVVGGIDVGGGSSGQQDGFSAYGSVGGQNQYNINGANTTDPDALGASSMYYSTGAFEEVAVSTASHDVENQTPGVILNMVTKSGSNDWHGGAKFFWEDDSFVSENVDDELRAQGIEQGQPNELLSDLDLQLGGPIVKDRAWFFVDYWDFTVETAITGVPGAIDDTVLEDWTLSGTWQIDDANKFTARYLTNKKFRGNRGTDRFTPPSAGWIQDSFVDIPQLQWQGVLTQNTFLDVRFSKMDMEFPLEAKDEDSPAPDSSCCPLDPTIDTGLDAQPVGSEPLLEVFFQRDNTSLSGNISHYLTSESSSHDFKFGADYQRTQSFSPVRYGVRGVWQYKNLGDPTFALLWNTPTKDIFEANAGEAALEKGQQAGLYAQDSWTFNNRLTVNAGVRFDWSTGWLPAQKRLESNWPELGPNFQAEDIPARDAVTSWNDIVPRIGATYDLFGDGRTALKANFSMYSQTQGLSIANDVNRNGNGWQFYFWDDANGDGVFQFGEQNTLLAQAFPGATREVDADLSSPLTREVTGGVEHELMDNFLVSVTGVWRDTYNMDSFVNFCPPDSVPDPSICAANPGIPYGPLAAQLGIPDPYTPVQVQDPGPDGVLGTADDGGSLTIFSQDPSTFGQGFDFRTNANERFGFPDGKRGYKGVSFVAHKRWSDNWQVLASWDVGETKFAGGSLSGFGEDPNDDFNGREQLSSADRLHNIKVTASYLFEEPIGVNIGMFLRSMSGQAVSRSVRYGSDDGLAQGGTTILVAGRGQDTIGPEREDHVNILDFRAEKQFTVGRFGVLHAYFDWFNITNTNTVTSFRTRSGPNHGLANAIVPPRVFRIGAAWDF